MTVDRNPRDFLSSIWLLTTLSLPSACPSPWVPAGSARQLGELRGEWIGRGGQKSQGRGICTNQRVYLLRGLLGGPRHAHNSSSSSPWVKEKRRLNGSVGRGEDSKRGIENQKREKKRVREMQIQMSMCRHSEESLLADRVIYWILPVNHCRPVAKRISSKAERQPRETGL